MRNVEVTNKAKKDIRRLKKQGIFDDNEFEALVTILANDDIIPSRYLDHPLHGEYEGMRECHIFPDWLLIYQKSDDKLTLYLIRSGSHSDLF